MSNDATPAARAAAAERFRPEVDDAPVMLWVTGPDGRCVYLSRAWYDFTAQSPETGLGFGWVDAVHPEDRGHVHASFVAANAARQRYSVEYRLRAGDGGYRWVLDSAAPRFDERGAYLGYIGSVVDISDRKAAEERLRRGHDTFFNLIEIAPFGVYIVDAGFRLRQVSTAAQKVFENVRPLLGRDFAEVLRTIWAEPFATEAIARFRHTLASGEPFRADSTIEQRHDIPVVESYDWALERVTLPDGEYGVVCYFYDVTARLRAAEHLRHAAESNAKFRTMFDQGMQFAGLLSTDGTVLEANRLSLEACGYVREDVVGRRFWDCGWWNRSPGLMQRVRAACEEAALGRLYRAELDYFVADGTRRTVDLTIAPVISDDGRVLFLSPTGVDTTDQRRIAGELRDSQAHAERQRQLYQAILDNTPDLAYIFDLDHRFIYANDVLLRMWGRTWDEAIGRNCLELGYEPWHAQMHDREIEQVIATREAVRGKVPFQGTFGRRIYDYIFVPVLDADGVVVAVAGTTRDVTDAEQAERDLRKLADELAESDRHKTEFLAMLAHELRNPLAPIRNAVRLMSHPEAGPTAIRAASAMMERQITQMVRLVDDLLDVSRISRGRIELRRETVDLRAVVEQAIESCRPAIDAARHRLELALPPQPVLIDGDPVRLAQVFANLLNNACKYSNPGGRIDVSAALHDGGVAVTVADTGHGIPADKLPMIFEMFTQVDQSLERTQGGLGIGLTLVKSLVELHGGTVEAHSDGLGHGSRFVVRLPVLSQALRAPEPAAASGTTGSARPRRILVVDDNRDAAKSLAVLLELSGHVTRTAFDGLEAVEAAAAFEPDVVLLDIGLPKLNGYDACRRIREQPTQRRIAIVALTGWGQEQDRRQSREAGFDAHMVKPVDPDELARTLAELTA